MLINNNIIELQELFDYAIALLSLLIQFFNQMA